MPRTQVEFLGREVELRRLAGALDVACDGSPVFVLVSGEAGIGKTRLLDELSRMADGRGCLTLRGRAAEFEGELPFGLLTDALDAYLRSLGQRAVDRLATDRLGALAAVFPSLWALDAAVDYPITAPERFRAHQAVRELIERLAARRAAVLILDDLQWADGASLELIAYLLRRPPEAGVAVAMALRSGRRHREVHRMIDDAVRAHALTIVELGPLPLESVRRLVGADVGDVEHLYHQSGGNPFYALELARGRGDDDGAASPDGGGVPPAVARAISSELDGLSPAARILAEAASVAGDPFDLDLAAATSGAPEEEVLRSLDELVSQDLVRRTDLPRRFQFRHPLVRGAVYGSLSPSTRISCHRRAGEAVAERGAPATAIATHVEHAARYGDAHAIDVLRRAGAAGPHQRRPLGRGGPAAPPQGRAGGGAGRPPRVPRRIGGRARPVRRRP
jgi:predicted ATPase